MEPTYVDYFSIAVNNPIRDISFLTGQTGLESNFYIFKFRVCRCSKVELVTGSEIPVWVPFLICLCLLSRQAPNTRPLGSKYAGDRFGGTWL